MAHEECRRPESEELDGEIQKVDIRILVIDGLVHSSLAIVFILDKINLLPSINHNFLIGWNNIKCLKHYDSMNLRVRCRFEGTSPRIVPPDRSWATPH